MSLSSIPSATSTSSSASSGVNEPKKGALKGHKVVAKKATLPIDKENFLSPNTPVTTASTPAKKVTKPETVKAAQTAHPVAIAVLSSSSSSSSPAPPSLKSASKGVEDKPESKEIAADTPSGTMTSFNKRLADQWDHCFPSILCDLTYEDVQHLTVRQVMVLLFSNLVSIVLNHSKYGVADLVKLLGYRDALDFNDPETRAQLEKRFRLLATAKTLSLPEPYTGETLVVAFRTCLDLYVEIHSSSDLSIERPLSDKATGSEKGNRSIQRLFESTQKKWNDYHLALLESLRGEAIRISNYLDKFAHDMEMDKKLTKASPESYTSVDEQIRSVKKRVKLIVECVKFATFIHVIGKGSVKKISKLYAPLQELNLISQRAFIQLQPHIYTPPAPLPSSADKFTPFFEKQSQYEVECLKKMLDHPGLRELQKAHQKSRVKGSLQSGLKQIAKALTTICEEAQSQFGGVDDENQQLEDLIKVPSAVKKYKSSSKTEEAYVNLFYQVWREALYEMLQKVFQLAAKIEDPVNFKIIDKFIEFSTGIFQTCIVVHGFTAPLEGVTDITVQIQKMLSDWQVRFSKYFTDPNIRPASISMRCTALGDILGDESVALFEPEAFKLTQAGFYMPGLQLMKWHNELMLMNMPAPSIVEQHSGFLDLIDDYHDLHAKKDPAEEEIKEETELAVDEEEEIAPTSEETSGSKVSAVPKPTSSDMAILFLHQMRTLWRVSSPRPSKDKHPRVQEFIFNLSRCTYLMSALLQQEEDTPTFRALNGFFFNLWGHQALDALLGTVAMQTGPKHKRLSHDIREMCTEFGVAVPDNFWYGKNKNKSIEARYLGTPLEEQEAKISKELTHSRFQDLLASLLQHSGSLRQHKTKQTLIEEMTKNLALFTSATKVMPKKESAASSSSVPPLTALQTLCATSQACLEGLVTKMEAIRKELESDIKENPTHPANGILIKTNIQCIQNLISEFAFVLKGLRGLNHPLEGHLHSFTYLFFTHYIVENISLLVARSKDLLIDRHLLHPELLKDYLSPAAFETLKLIADIGTSELRPFSHLSHRETPSPVVTLLLDTFYYAEHQLEWDGTTECIGLKGGRLAAEPLAIAVISQNRMLVALVEELITSALPKIIQEFTV